MQDFKRLMVDIETMDSGPTAAVIAIGACVFDLERIYDSFSTIIDKDLAQVHGSVSARTMDWWSTQNEEVRERMFSGVTRPTDAAAGFAAFVRRNNVKEVWANSPSFDCVILQNLFRQVEIKTPWQFRDERCVRTIYAVGREMGIEYNLGYSETGAHDAVIDARNQARAVSIILRRIYGKLL